MTKQYNIPCIDCLCLVMCRAKLKKFEEENGFKANIFIINDIEISSCSLIANFIRDNVTRNREIEQRLDILSQIFDYLEEEK